MPTPMVGQAQSGIGNAQAVYNQTQSSRGPLAVPIRPDFSVQTSYEIDMSILNNFGTLDFVQTLYIDNAGNDAPCIVYNVSSQHRIVAPANSQGWYPFLCPSPSKFTVTSAGGKVVPIEVVNFPVSPCVWTATGQSLVDLPQLQFSIISTAAAMVGNIKSAPGRVRSLMAFNDSVNKVFLKLYDTAAAPVAGVGVPTWRAMIPANVDGAGFVIPIPGGLQFLNGIGFAMTGGIADNDATVIDANKVLLNVGYQ